MKKKEVIMLIPYAAPAEPFHKETEIKKSIFIAHLVPVNSEEEAQKTLEGFRKQYKDATHNCYAWRIGTERVMENRGTTANRQAPPAIPCSMCCRCRSSPTFWPW